MEIKARLGILGSGKGSNMFALAEACRQGVIRAEIAQVVSDVENAGILDRAKDFDIPATYLSPGPFRTKLDEGAELNYIRLFREAKVDWIVLAGFMRILKGDFLKAFPNQVLNIHPSLLPSFPGLEPWKQALEYGVKYTGCTVHFVDQGIDTGAIILQETVPVMDDDTPQSLHARIQDAEHHLYPAAVGLAVEGRLEVRGRLCSKVAI